MHIFLFVPVGNGNEIPLPLRSHNCFPVIDFVLQFMAQSFSHHIFISSGHRNELISVRNKRRMTGNLRKAFRILLCKSTHLTDRGIFFQNNLPFPVGKYLQRIAFPDTQRPSDFLRYDNTA